MAKFHDRTARLIAAGLCGLCLAVLAGYPLVLWTASQVSVLMNPSVLLFALIATLLGTVVVVRRPRLAAGWLLLAAGVSSAGLAFVIVLQNFPSFGDEPGGYHLVRVTRAFFRQAGHLALVLLPLVYPDRRLGERGWRWLYLGLTAWFAAGWLARVVQPAASPSVPANPWGLPQAEALAAGMVEWGEPVRAVLTWGGVGLLLLRFRRAEPDGRRQIGWFLLAVLIENLCTVAWELTRWGGFALVDGAPAIPLAVLLAITRYRLYAIDTLVGRAVIGGVLVGGVAATYLGAAALAGFFLADHGRLVGVVTAVVAGSFFRPVQRGIQRRLDRLLYGRSGDPQTHARALRDQIQHAGPADALGAAVEAVMNGLAVRGAAVDLGAGSPDAGPTRGDLGGTAREIPLVWHGHRVGTLLLGAPGVRRFPRAYERRMLGALVPIVADAAHAVRLAEDLRRTRERAAGVAEEERRRLHRDLRDGLGSRLTGMALALDSARHSLDGSPDRADRLLGDLRLGMDAVTEEIRDLVHDLRPGDPD
ncbi:histidine kinase dimerization/phosphoacceptor domain-containing protein [Nonomuraea sp. NPDC050310]|uniref:histidine kinase dimerization/phosphoacceptor domain-containing protein n=1 Tax=Nonomuraea sp. NPDC050310 TaxID=3154935 RepID=UPI0033DAE287